MKIIDVKLSHLSVPLKKTFKTALRTVNSAEETVVKIFTDTGEVGYGEAAPTAVITGDTNESIRGIINDKLKVGKEMKEDIESKSDKGCCQERDSNSFRC